MIICVCHRVSDRDIARAAQQGCTSFDELQFELGVASRCGKCRECAQQVLAQHAGQPMAVCAPMLAQARMPAAG